MIPNKNRIAKGLYWDKSLTLVDGCTKVDESCSNCWSIPQTIRLRSFHKTTRHRDYRDLTHSNEWTGNIKCNYSLLDVTLPKKETVYCIWNDLFHEKIEYTFFEKALSYMMKYPQHKFIILTKRSAIALQYLLHYLTHSYNKRLNDFLQDTEHIILGVSIPSNKHIDRLSVIQHAPLKNIMISYSPVLGPIDWMNLPATKRKKAFDWIVIESESGINRRRVKDDFLHQAIRYTTSNDIPVFLKQWDFGKGLIKLPHLYGRIYDNFPWI